MNDDGSNVRRLTFNEYDDNNPAFCPSKKRIAFHRAMDSTDFTSYEIFVLNLETGNTTTFLNFDTLDRPLWSPNSQYLVFERAEDWNEDGFAETKIWVLQHETGTERAVSSPQH